jgi:hypothetical protein
MFVVGLAIAEATFGCRCSGAECHIASSVRPRQVRWKFEQCGDVVVP